MDKPRIINYNAKPEAKIQGEIIEGLRLHQWFVKILHGNVYQSGMPDLFACKRSSGWRFIECKQPIKYMFTEAQCETFPRLAAGGVNIWVMTAWNDHEYKKLFQPCNWYHYFTPNHMRSGKPKSKQPPPAKGPEAEIQRRVILRLECEGWFVKVLHGDLYQHGFPDLFACRKGDGFRFVEIKRPSGSRWTAAQYECFPRLASEGVGIWVLNSPDMVPILKEPPNFWEYMYRDKML